MLLRIIVELAALGALSFLCQAAEAVVSAAEEWS